MDPEHKVDDDSVESQRPITPPTESQDIAEQKASQPSEAQPSTPPDTAEGNGMSLHQLCLYLGELCCRHSCIVDLQS